jgi:hypothetical protein
MRTINKQSKKQNTHNKNKKRNTKKMLRSIFKQKGGANNRKLLFSRDEYKNNFDVIFNNLLLYKHDKNQKFKTKNNNIEKYLFDKLNKLMTINKKNNNEIDLSFINEVYSFPYLDVAGFFAINKTKKDDKTHYEFINKDKDYQIYNIDKIISSGTGAGDILLLKKKAKLKNVDDYPEELVLKLYNKKPITIQKNEGNYNSFGEGDYKFIRKDEIMNYGYKDYTSYSSLKVFNISKTSKFTITGNYYDMNFETFCYNNQAFNLNRHNCLIQKFNTKLLKGGGSSNNNSNGFFTPDEEATAIKGKSQNSNNSSSNNNLYNSRSEVKYSQNIPMSKNDLVDKSGKYISDHEYIYLATAYDDFINEYIQQIIMKNVITKYDSKYGTNYIDNIMNFYNAMIIPVNDGTNVNYYGCLIMEKVDGNVRDFLQLTDINDNNKIKYLIKCIKKINNVLKILKNPNNCFCHTDLKIENVFYKQISTDKYKFILADYDKSSITFNKIRFYNNGFDSKFRPFTSEFAGFGYNIIEKKKEYVISRPETGKVPTLNGIEGEQLFLRYNPFPTIMKFDINMFIISIYFNALEIMSFVTNHSKNNNSTKQILDSNKNLIQISNELTNLKFENYIAIRNAYALSDIRDYSNYNGNFGKLLFYSNILNNNKFSYDYKLKNYYVNNSINISNISDNGKLIISTGLNNIDNICTKPGLVSSSTKAYDKKTGVELLYTGNVKLICEGMLGKYIYFKTNRYSYNNLLYEWDYCKLLNTEAKFNMFWEFVKNSINK